MYVFISLTSLFVDNLLEDLQNTVSRPGSSLDKHYTQTYVQESSHPTTYLTDEFYDYKVILHLTRM